MGTGRRWLVASVIALAVVGVAGCAPGTPTSNATNEPEEIEPVVNENFPDPDVLTVDGTHYAFATNGNGKNVQVAESSDLQTWEVLEEDALPDLPSWVIPGKTWAPEVTQLAPEQFVMYFTATNFQPAVQCIGVATATEPTGPFVVQGAGMLVCPAEEGGAIDASTYSENGTHYLLWKNDGNCCGFDTWISMAPLAPDGLTLAQPGARLIKQGLPWEGNLVEAPTLIKRDGSYYLFYSANSYADERYAVGYAQATTLTGPWEKADEPFFSSESEDGLYIGPGGQDIIREGDSDFIVFHAWDDALTYRAMFVEPLEWADGAPRVDTD